MAIGSLLRATRTATKLDPSLLKRVPETVGKTLDPSLLTPVSKKPLDKSLLTRIETEKGTTAEPAPLSRQGPTVEQPTLPSEIAKKNLAEWQQESTVKHRVFHGDVLEGEGSKDLLNDPMAFDQPREMGVHVGDTQQAAYFSTKQSRQSKAFNKQSPTEVAQEGFKDVKTKDEWMDEGIEDLKEELRASHKFLLRTGVSKDEAYKTTLGKFNRGVDAIKKSADARGFIEPYYVNIKRPLMLEDAGNWAPNALIPQLRDKFKGDKDSLARLDEIEDMPVSDEGGAKAAKAIWDLLDEIGFDSISYVNTAEGHGRMSYILRDREQVKSAVGNTGEYKKNTDNILRSIIGVGAGTGAVVSSKSEEDEDT